MSTCAFLIFERFSRPSKIGIRSEIPMPFDLYQWFDSPEWTQFLILSVYAMYVQLPVSASVGSVSETYAAPPELCAETIQSREGYLRALAQDYLVFGRYASGGVG